jgi:hypothetical protein
VKRPLFETLQIRVSFWFEQLGGIARINLTSSEENIASSNRVFHHFISPSMSLLTIASGSNTTGAEQIQYVLGLGNHMSFHILIEDPLTTLQINPSFRRSQELWILLHEKKGRRPNRASKMELSGLYLAFIILATKLSG